MTQTQYNPGVPEEIVVEVAPANRAIILGQLAHRYADDAEYALKQYRKARKALRDVNALLVMQENLVAAQENLTQAVENLAVAVELLGIKQEA